VEVLDVIGAPFDQGATQGRAFADALRAHAAELAARSGRWLGLELRAAAHYGPERAMLHHTLQQHERLQGIAAASGVPITQLALAGSLACVRGTASVCGAVLEARLDVPAALAPLLLLRRSLPDQVSLRSVELSAAPFPGCLAGLNERGIGIAVIDDRDVRELSLRALAQDLLMRATEIDSALGLLARRARYAGGSGALCIADGLGHAFQIELRAGELSSRELAPRTHAIAESTLQLDLRALALVYRTADGSEIRAELDPSGESAPA
jgi:hypothetical protein